MGVIRWGESKVEDAAANLIKVEGGANHHGRNPKLASAGRIGGDDGVGGARMGYMLFGDTLGA